MTKQMSLFQEKEIPKKAKNNILTCRKCRFRYKHYYGSMFYCSKQKDVRTSYGHRKIKASDEACGLYELD